jgi:hypothetical protein
MEMEKIVQMLAKLQARQDYNQEKMAANQEESREANQYLLTKIC